MIYLARPNERLEEHLTEVGGKMVCRSDNPVYAEIIGLLHDIGKYSVAFQNYLPPSCGQIEDDETDSSGKPDHSSAGAQLVMSILRKKVEQTDDTEVKRLAELIGRIIAHPIVGHHTGLLDSISTGNGASLGKRPVRAEDLKGQVGGGS